MSATPPGSSQQTGSGQQSSQQTIQAVKDLTSALGTLLKGVGAANGQTIQVLEDLVIGVVSVALAATPATAALAAIVAVVGAVAAALTSQGPDEIQQIAQKLQALIQQVEQGDAVTALNQRIANIQEQVGPAQTILQQLSSLQQNPPVDPAVINQTLQAPQTAINNLNPPADPSQPAGLWAVALPYTVSWNDSDSPDLNYQSPNPLGGSISRSWRGYGEQAPPAFANNVFNYTSVLPAYLYVLSIFLTIGALIDPMFKQHYTGSVLTPTATFLQSVYNYIVSNGLKELVPQESVNAESLSQWFGTISPYGPNLLTPVGISGAMTPEMLGGIPTGNLDLVGVTIEYGYVETFSGYSSVGLYTVLSPYSSNANYGGKFQIRLLRRYKDVYVGTGLLKLWETINNFLQLSGQAAKVQTPPTLADWSFQRDIVGNANVSRLEGSKVISTSLRDVMNFFLNTPPGDVPQSLFLSFRNVLSV
jgi:hypothetical protein